MPPAMVKLKRPPLTTGALIVGLTGLMTVTKKFCIALKLGEPLSATFTLIGCVIGDCAMVGRQVNTPLLALTLAPLGGLSKLNDNNCAGTSASAARFVNVNV